MSTFVYFHRHPIEWSRQVVDFVESIQQRENRQLLLHLWRKRTNKCWNRMQDFASSFVFPVYISSCHVNNYIRELKFLPHFKSYYQNYRVFVFMDILYQRYAGIPAECAGPASAWPSFKKVLGDPIPKAIKNYVYLPGEFWKDIFMIFSGLSFTFVKERILFHRQLIFAYGAAACKVYWRDTNLVKVQCPLFLLMNCFFAFAG